MVLVKRKRSDHPTDYTTSYQVMGGLIGLSLLDEGYLRLDPDNPGSKEKNLLKIWIFIIDIGQSDKLELI